MVGFLCNVCEYLCIVIQEVWFVFPFCGRKVHYFGWSTIKTKKTQADIQHASSASFCLHYHHRNIQLYFKRNMLIRTVGVFVKQTYQFLTLWSRRRNKKMVCVFCIDTWHTYGKKAIYIHSYLYMQCACHICFMFTWLRLPL